MTDRELLQMALDALEDVADDAEESHKTVSAIKALRARLAQPEQECRNDGRCQYAIDHGAEGMGHCPKGQCCMPKAQPEQEEDYDAIANKQLASLKAAAKVTFEDAVVRAVHKLYNAPPQPKPERYTTDAMKIKQAVSEAVLQQAEQEPTAYLCENAVGHKYFRWKKPSSEYKPIALYTAHASPQRIWQGLTDEEIKDHWITCMWKIEGTALPIPEFARAIEDKLKEKNT